MLNRRPILPELGRYGIQNLLPGLGRKGMLDLRHKEFEDVRLSPNHRSCNYGSEQMCEANAYLLRDGKEELFMEAVDVIENEGGTLRVTSIFGEQKAVRGRIRSMSLVEHRIILEE